MAESKSIHKLSSKKKKQAKELLTALKEAEQHSKGKKNLKTVEAILSGFSL